MEANREEVDPSGQELIEGSTIAGEISSVNHTSPSPSATPIEGRVNLSDDQRRERKREADQRYNKKRRRNEAELKEELDKLEDYSDELELENGNLKRKRDRMEARVDEENNIILSQLVDNYAGQNTEVQKARINFIGETSTGQDGLNELKQEMNQAPITITSNTIFGENASMNLQTLPRLAQPAGSSGLPDNKQARKRMADKKYRDKTKWTTNAVAARTKELKEKNVKMESDNAVLKAEANQLQKHFDQLRNISKKMAFKDARRNAKLEKVLDGLMLPFEVTRYGTGETGLPVHHPPIYQSGTAMGSGGLANEDSPGLPQSHVSQGLTHNHNQGSTLNTQLPFEVTGFSTGGTGLPVHHPPVYQSGTTMGSGGLANENSPGLPQSHVSLGLTHLPWGGMTPDNTFDTWEAGPPVHQPPVYLSETTIRPEGPAIEYPPELPQSHPPQGWPHENNFEQPGSTYGDQFIEVSGCSNNIDGCYI